VYSSSFASISSTPFAASTSRALAVAGSDSACVSVPRNSGPSIPCCLRYSQIAWLIASTCHSLKLLCNELPRCPEVPKLTCCSAIAGSGRPV
jgi:hypothetical protein